jgi:hypothetical protein
MSELVKPKKKAPKRIAVEVTQEQYETIKRNFEHGMQQRVLEVMIEDMCQLLEEYGQIFILAMLEKRLSYKQFMEKHLEKRAS